MKTFNEWWKEVQPDYDPEDITSLSIIAAQRSAALQGWNTALEEMQKGTDNLKANLIAE